MPESFVRIPPDSTGKKLRSVTHPVLGQEVHTHTTVLVDYLTGDALSLASDTTLQDVLTALSPKLAEGGTVALDATTVAALTTAVNTTVSGTVSVSNFPATQTVSGTVSVSNLPATQAVSGTVSVANFPATQTVSGTVTVSNPTADPETGLAKDATLASILAALSDKLAEGGTVALDAASLAALETINATVSGTVAVSNFPADQTVSGTVTATGPLTDTQLRDTDVEVRDDEAHAALGDIKRGVTDYRKLIDWDADGQPIYVGLDAQDALTTDPTWTIQRTTWVDGNPTDIQVLTGIWDDRAALGWSV